MTLSMNLRGRRVTPGLVARAFAVGCAWVCLFLLVLWSMFALWFDSSRHAWVAGLLTVGFAGGCVALLVWFRPLPRAWLAVGSSVLLVILWWNLIPARNDRDWAPDVAQLSNATVEGNLLTIRNVRNFDYRSETDFSERWETRTYDLEKLLGVDMFLSYWGPTLIAHTIASWQFSESPPLAISIETRKEKGESYSALRGFFRQFELYYVVADERDVIRLRTHFRGEHVSLYHLRMRPEGARKVLLDYIKDINQLAEQPRWYNALTNNCTTTIRHHALHVGEGNPWDWRILANGRIDQLGYERKIIDTSLPFDELKAISQITEKAKAAAPESFSLQIREGLPGGFGVADAAEPAGNVHD